MAAIENGVGAEVHTVNVEISRTNSLLQHAALSQKAKDLGLINRAPSFHGEL